MRDSFPKVLLLNAAFGAGAALVGALALFGADAWGFRDLLMAGPDGLPLLAALTLQGAILLGGGVAVTAVFANAGPD